MFNGILDNTVYIKVYKNKFHIRHIESKNEIVALPEIPFTTERLIIGQFKNAEIALRKGCKKLYLKKWITPSPKVLIQQMEMNEGGLSDVEGRTLKEVSMVVGARAVFVWTGKELTDAEVLDKIKNV